MENREYFQKSWPFKWWWLSEEDRLVDIKPIQKSDFYDDQWGVERLSDILDYLRKAPVVLAGFAPEEKCPDCGRMVYYSGIHCDDEWSWGSDLAHYVEYHNAFLPNAMVEWIKSRSYTPPNQIVSRYPDIPSPDSDAKRLGRV